MPKRKRQTERIDTLPLFSSASRRKAEQQSTSCSKKEIPVADIFYSIQGEGFNVGIPSIFVRFAGCNLRCVWCDSLWAVDKQVILAKFRDTDEDASSLLKFLLHKSMFYETGRANIVFTGGEPTLYTPFLARIIRNLKDVYSEMKDTPLIPSSIKSIDDFLSSISFEVETNGLIYPAELIDAILETYGKGKKCLNRKKLVLEISPKVLVGYMRERTKEVISNLNRLIEDEGVTTIDYICKFVSKGDYEHIEKIERFVEEAEIPREKVYLMPLIESEKDYPYVGRQVANVCMQKHFRFSPREHIVLFGKDKSA